MELPSSEGSSSYELPSSERAESSLVSTISLISTSSACEEPYAESLEHERGSDLAVAFERFDPREVALDLEVRQVPSRRCSWSLFDDAKWHLQRRQSAGLAGRLRLCGALSGAIAKTCAIGEGVWQRWRKLVMGIWGATSETSGEHGRETVKSSNCMGRCRWTSLSSRVCVLGEAGQGVRLNPSEVCEARGAGLRPRGEVTVRAIDGATAG